jgi:arylsulfatase
MGASGLQIGGGGLRLGHDSGFPVSDVYTPPCAWTGVLHTVTFSDSAPLGDAHRREHLTELMQRE